MDHGRREKRKGRRGKGNGGETFDSHFLVTP